MTALVSSSADSFSGSLNADGFTTTIDPFAPVSGSAPPAYDDTTQDRFFRPHVRSDLGGGEHSVPDDAGHPHGQHRGMGPASAWMRSGRAARRISARPVSCWPILRVPCCRQAFWACRWRRPGSIAVRIRPSCSDRNEGSISGDASFHSLKVTGALLGGDTLTFSGNATPNTVLYSSSTVTITLDEQTLLLPPAAASGIIGPTITTDAIDIHLNHATFAGQTITGNFDIGQSSASYALMPPHALAHG